MTDELYDTNDLAKYFSASRATIDRWRKSGVLRFLKVGGQYRFKKSDVEAFIEAHTVPAVAQETQTN